jgi:hypothetical protein
MSDTSGPTSGTPLAQYDPIERCWKTSEATCLWALTLSYLTLPTWGVLRDGELFEHPTPGRLTSAPGCSSLPTPTAQASQHMTLDDRGEGTQDDHNLWAIAGRLLPTPVVNDPGRDKTQEWWANWVQKIGQHGESLSIITRQLSGEPTPQPSNDGKPSQDAPHHPQLSIATDCA